MLKACDCYKNYCEHNPPEGYKHMKIKGKGVFIKENLSFIDKLKLLFKYKVWL